MILKCSFSIRISTKRVPLLQKFQFGEFDNLVAIGANRNAEVGAEKLGDITEIFVKVIFYLSFNKIFTWVTTLTED